MTDLHPRILRMVAKQRQRALDDHSAAELAGGPRSGADRRDLERAAGQTKASGARPVSASARSG
jgi:hypothetical protein